MNGTDSPFTVASTRFSPNLIKGHLADRCEDVDVVLFGTKPEVFFVIQKIAGFKTLKEDTKRTQRLKGGACVFDCGPDEEVEIMGGSHIPVCVDSHAAHDCVFNPGGGERG